MALMKCSAIHDKPKATMVYIMNPEKTKSGELVTGINVIKNADLADKKMKFYRDRFKSSNKVKAMHIIHSFSDRENITPEKAHEISMEWYKRVFPSEALAIAATHIKRENMIGENCLHTHFLINNVCRDGIKIRTDKEFIKKALEVSNEVCKEYGLEHSFINFEKILPNKSYYEWQQEKLGNGWKQKIREDIDELISKSSDLNELIESLRAKGYEVKTGGKYISVRPEGKERFVRLKTLGYFYSEEKIKDRIEKDKFKDLEGVSYRRKGNKKYIDYDVYRFKHKKGTLGNILELTSLIIKAKLGIESNNKSSHKNYRNNKALKELEVIAKALETVDKYKIEKNEDIVKIYSDVESELLKLDKWKTKAQKRMDEINNIADKIEELSKLKNKEVEVNTRVKEDKEKKEELRALAKTYDYCIKEYNEEIREEQSKDKKENKER